MNKMFGSLDNAILLNMKRIYVPAMRFSFGVIFIWFGILKPLGVSPAEGLLKATVQWLPLGEANQWLIVIGWWEVIIGILFLFKRTTKAAIMLLFIQMAGTFMPLVFLPEVTFQNGSVFVPSMEGQYIIKNLIIISAALVLGAQCNSFSSMSKPKTEPTY